MATALETLAAPLGEPELRRQIDRALSRAIVDPEFAAVLLADPVVALGRSGCTPQQRLELRGIRARDLKDFAVQAETLFWPSRQPSSQKGHVALVAGF